MGRTCVLRREIYLKTIWFDLDGVLASFVDHFLPLVNQALDMRCYYNDVTSFSFEECIGLTKEQVSALMQTAAVCGLYKRLPVYEGVCPNCEMRLIKCSRKGEAVRCEHCGYPSVSAKDAFEVMATGATLKAITMRPYEAVEDTMDWVNRHGFIFDEVVFVKSLTDKWEHIKPGDILIEDSSTATESVVEHSEGNVILISQPWNKQFEADDERVYRAYSWFDVLQAVCKINIKEYGFDKLRNTAAA